jgi:hypothetical protein
MNRVETAATAATMFPARMSCLHDGLVTTSIGRLLFRRAWSGAKSPIRQEYSAGPMVMDQMGARSRLVAMSVKESQRTAHLFKRAALRSDPPAPFDQCGCNHQRRTQIVACRNARARTGIYERAEQPRRHRTADAGAGARISSGNVSLTVK